MAYDKSYDTIDSLSEHATPEARVKFAERKAHLAEMRSILGRCEAEKRDLNQREDKRYSELKDKISKIDDFLNESQNPEARGRHVGTSSFTSPGSDYREGEIRCLKPEEKISDYVRSRSLGDDFGGPLDWGRYIRTMITGDSRHGEAEARALSIGISPSGGYLVPEPLSAQVLDLARNRTAVVNVGATSIPMESNTLDLARVTSDPVAGWKAENESAEFSEMTFGRYRMTARTLVALIRMSVELVEDATNLSGIVENAIAQSLAIELDRAALFGSGVGSEPLGLFNVEGTNEISLGDNGGALDSLVIFFQARQPILEANGEDMGCGVIMAPRTQIEIESLKDTTGQAIVPPPAWTNMRRFSTNQIGVDMEHGTAENASCCFVGDFREMLIGMRTALSIELSRQAGDASGSAFKELQVWLRAYLRADILVARPSWFTIIKGIIPPA